MHGHLQEENGGQQEGWSSSLLVAESAGVKVALGVLRIYKREVSPSAPLMPVSPHMFGVLNVDSVQQFRAGSGQFSQHGLRAEHQQPPYLLQRLFQCCPRRTRTWVYICSLAIVVATYLAHVEHWARLLHQEAAPGSCWARTWLMSGAQ